MTLTHDYFHIVVQSERRTRWELSHPVARETLSLPPSPAAKTISDSCGGGGDKRSAKRGRHPAGGGWGQGVCRVPHPLSSSSTTNTAIQIKTKESKKTKQNTVHLHPPSPNRFLISGDVATSFPPARWFPTQGRQQGGGGLIPPSDALPV